MAQDNSTNGIFSMTTIVRTACLASAVTLLSFPLQAKEPGHAKAAVVTPVLKTDKTITGGKLTLPQGDVEVAVSQYEIAPGATLPIHKHPYPRYAYVFSGKLRVSNKDTGKSSTFKAGDFIVESINQWHSGTNIGSKPLKLLVIDQVRKGENNVIMKK
ncbi:quercetin dioxygenase-like cupin family protein [Ochrobactrum daejeonense]|uniref:Quercetin dioxygenase-like cupin family protein n=1 Tax=Brucella daejeonensis TaxID=659015 RepID=A0A7W9EMQ4_9HYPH|nr:cupin domain-containing protein [Brucella daejeonensis]MBB5702300.1 quercetin dioxygenase-like cupin family protein [Brucella daejeonensis]